jgi:hypothetical protein
MFEPPGNKRFPAGPVPKTRVTPDESPGPVLMITRAPPHAITTRANTALHTTLVNSCFLSKGLFMFPDPPVDAEMLRIIASA